MPELRVTELDFFQIKSNLQSFLSAQTEFRDYDFTGSALSVLLDVLAYNTHYNAVLAHMVSNELFIDTAIKRSSVVSHAKMLGYIPRSATAARARVRVVVTPTGTQTSMVLTPATTFSASINGQQFTFSPATTYFATKQAGAFTFPEVVLLEGIRLTNTYVVGSDQRSGPFVIPVDTMDASTLSVDVLDNVIPTPYRRANTIVDVGPGDRVFWVEEAASGRYQIVFGDNVIGRMLSVGNRVSATYIACSGAEANGARTFTINGALSGETAITVTTISPAASGAPREDIDEIRRNAPKFNATRNRVVTAQDYETLILSEFARAKSVVVWGGEDNAPPIYGKVFITLDPNDGEIITDTDKDFITDAILRPRAMMTIRHEFVDPEYAHLGFNLSIRYNSRNTTLSTQDIEQIVRTSISTYFTTVLQSLDQGFVYSQFIDFLQNEFEPGVIDGILCDVTIQRRVNVLETRQTAGVLHFLTHIRPRTFTSTKFRTVVNDVEYVAYVRDVQKNETTGLLELVDSDTGSVILSSMGSIDYVTGRVSYYSLAVIGYFGEAQDLRFTVRAEVLGQNIFSRITRTTEFQDYAVVALPSKNTILRLDDSTADPISGLANGLRITVTPIVTNS